PMLEGCRWTFTRGSSIWARRSRVPSVDPSSTMMSSPTHGESRTRLVISSMVPISLKHGITTDSNAVDAVSSIPAIIGLRAWTAAVRLGVSSALGAQEQEARDRAGRHVLRGSGQEPRGRGWFLHPGEHEAVVGVRVRVARERTV